jgi:type I restriction enzyme, S subunit
VSKARCAWEQTTSGDLCEYITSGSRDWKKYYSDKGALFIRTQDINRDKLDLSDVARVALPRHVEGKRSRLQPGDLLMTITGANVGKVAIVPDDIPEAYVSQSVGLMRLKDNRFGKYIHYYLQGERSGRQHVMNMVYGMGRPVLSLQNLRDIPVPLPGLDEQREIVAEIEKQFTRMEAGVAGLRRVQANLKRYRAAVLKAACEGKLVPTEAELARQEGRDYETGAQLLERILSERRQKWSGKGKYKEPEKPDTTNLPTLPGGWSVASIDQLSSHVTSGSRDWSQFYGKGSGTFVLAQNIRPLHLDLSERQPVDAPQGEAETERTRIAVNDLLVTIVGAKTGDVCRVPIELTDHYVCQSVALLRPVLARCSRFAELYLASLENGQAQWKRYIYGQGRPHLSFEQLRMTAILLPPIAEQERIVAEVDRHLSVVEELEAVVNANLQRATRLRQSILQRAFEGNLVNGSPDRETDKSAQCL